MPGTPTVNLAGVTQAAVTYNPLLRELGYFQFNKTALALGLNILNVKNKDIVSTARRKAGILRPYKQGLTLGQEQEIIKFKEQVLEPVLTYAEIKDNILNYKEKNIVSAQGAMVDNKTKKHPLELIILKNVVLSYAEDVVFAMFFAERDDAVASPITSFTGFFPHLDALVVAGEIATGKSNLANTGAFDTGESLGIGTDGKNHYTRLVEWVRYGHPMLRGKECQLTCAENPILKAREGLRALTSSHNMPTTEEMLAMLRSDANAPGLKWAFDVALGTGDKLMLHEKGILDFGVNVGDSVDSAFVQVRNPYQDPNEIQYWIQAGYDTRIQDVHSKIFLTNERSNTRLDLAGDY